MIGLFTAFALGMVSIKAIEELFDVSRQRDVLRLRKADAARRRAEVERDCEKRKRIALRDALMNVRGLLNQRQRGVEPTYSRDHITAVIKNALMAKEDVLPAPQPRRMAND